MRISVNPASHKEHCDKSITFRDFEGLGASAARSFFKKYVNDGTVLPDKFSYYKNFDKFTYSIADLPFQCSGRMFGKNSHRSTPTWGSVWSKLKGLQEIRVFGREGNQTCIMTILESQQAELFVLGLLLGVPFAANRLNTSDAHCCYVFNISTELSLLNRKTNKDLYLLYVDGWKKMMDMRGIRYNEKDVDEFVADQVKGLK